MKIDGLTIIDECFVRACVYVCMHVSLCMYACVCA